mmetsp:Transcript_49125/g.97194  ORF Transcript_49125/g.97194 Transcript_49125/m.97194 type:complete len:250 (+) Transcript_49125:2-751(+)
MKQKTRKANANGQSGGESAEFVSFDSVEENEENEDACSFEHLFGGYFETTMCSSHVSEPFRTDENFSVALELSGSLNYPVIGICDTDVPLNWVSYAPCLQKVKAPRSIKRQWTVCPEKETATFMIDGVATKLGEGEPSYEYHDMHGWHHPQTLRLDYDAQEKTLQFYTYARKRFGKLFRNVNLPRRVRLVVSIEPVISDGDGGYDGGYCLHENCFSAQILRSRQGSGALVQEAEVEGSGDDGNESGEDY